MIVYDAGAYYGLDLETNEVYCWWTGSVDSIYLDTVDGSGDIRSMVTPTWWCPIYLTVDVGSATVDT